MNKRCGRCEKIVYPTEELKCLDQVWHRGCFKCIVCNTTLNMKNYKGFDKKPYCSPHYPTQKPTIVLDTPESRRIAENTKIQSNVQYHKEFEKSKSSFTCIAENPEIMRHMRNTQNISSVQYHREFEKSKSEYTQVADTVDMKRSLQNTKNRSLIDYHDDFEKNKDKFTTIVDRMDFERHKKNKHISSQIEYKKEFELQKDQFSQIADTVEMKRFKENARNVSMAQYQSDFEKSKGSYTQVANTLEMERHKQNLENFSPIKYHAEFEKQKGQKITVAEDPEVMRVKQNTQIQSSVHYKQVREQLQEMEHNRPAEPTSPTVDSTSARHVGSISDYDPMNDRFGSIGGEVTGGPRSNKAPQQPSSQGPPSPQAQQPKDQYAGKGMVCRAVYDYTAADSDEVSFSENDTIIFCQPIDAGWMEGTVEQTGQRGMLPANYVEKVH